MHKLSLRNYQAVSRAVLLFGVLAGLLFSCGEGIRLFPFPEPENIYQANFKRKSEEKIGYQKNVHRFETKQEKQSKFQRDNSPHHAADVFGSLNDSPFTVLPTVLKSDLSVDFQAAKSLEIAESLGSRAPPVPEFL